MPNWCEGSLKVRGTKENILNFIKNGLKAYTGKWVNSEYVEEEVDQSKWLDFSYFDINDPGYGPIEFNGADWWIHIDDTKRAFVNETIPIQFYETSVENKYIAVASIKQAWEFRVCDWLNIANEYDVDLKLYGIEQGAGFWQELSIVDGVIVENSIHGHDSSDYSSFVWDCPFPWMGG